MFVGRSVAQEIRDQLFHPEEPKTDTSFVRYDTRVGRRINAFLNLLRSSSPYKQGTTAGYIFEIVTLINLFCGHVMVEQS